MEQVSPPLNILYIAAYLRERISGVQISVVDGARHGYSHTISAIRKFHPDILGLSYYTILSMDAYELINEVKSERPDLPIIVGGPHASAFPEEALERSLADISVIGEGEEIVRQLVALYLQEGQFRAESIAKIKGIAFRQNGNISHTPPAPVIYDLDTIPFPARDLVSMQDYSGWYIYKRLPETNIISARGCAHRCTFCSIDHWKLAKPFLRLRSPQNVVDEIEELIRVYRIREFRDDADEFNNDLDNALEICEEIKRRGLDITWKCQLRAHPLPERLVKSMAEAGCWYVHLGIESGNPETLRGIKKGITLEQVLSATKLLSRYGIKVMGLFMVYNVWEEEGKLHYEDTAKSWQTLKFAHQLWRKKLIQHINWSVTTPFPGSELYTIAMRHNLIKPELITNWRAWLRKDSFVMRIPGVTAAEQARLKTFSQLGIALQLIRSGHIGSKDIGLYGRKLLKLLYNLVMAYIQDHGWQKLAKKRMARQKSG
jgi:radical SAM superfamily enzyme YgiQ (UPF0313 family)